MPITNIPLNPIINPFIYFPIKSDPSPLSRRDSDAIGCTHDATEPVGPTTAAVDFISVRCKTLTEEDNGGYKLEYKAANTIFKNKNYSISIYR